MFIFNRNKSKPISKLSFNLENDNLESTVKNKMFWASYALVVVASSVNI